MRKNELNAHLRSYVKEHLSPTRSERALVSAVYAAVCAVLGESACLRIGSYARFTSNRPVHDLDVLYVLGNWGGVVPNPTNALAELKERIAKCFVNPTSFAIQVSVQTHSVTIAFLRGDEEVFAVDIVPAYRRGHNDFGEDMYMVPEILTRGHQRRRQLYEELSRTQRGMNWIASDPRGYIHAAGDLNSQNADFRKSVKFPKAWKAACRRVDPNFKLKSFHIEQVITGYYQANAELTIFDAISRFFQELPHIIERAQIPDRANPAVNIDEYVNELTTSERDSILRARDVFLRKLEGLTSGSDVGTLLDTESRANAVATSIAPVVQSVPFTPRAPWAHEVD
ncbi:MAG TPA: hypothetical protein VJ875_02350 [Pyrinomonadaceae bacterium]|nr:hypothetical protein [Pyrinomonadaceae bacterium]